MTKRMQLTGAVILTLVLMGTFTFVFPQEKFNNRIVVGTMDVVKNLNPYLAESEIELALQELVFPPLIADYMQQGRRRKADTFKGILIGNSDLLRSRGEDYLEFYLQGNNVSPDIYLDNFNRIRNLGPKSKFSWNLSKAENRNNGRVRAYFKGKISLCKLIAATFPIVNFGAVKWSRSDKTFITNADRQYLEGFSHYRYDKIDSPSSSVHLVPKNNLGKQLQVTSFPDYGHLIERLKAGELHAAFNISSLTNLVVKDLQLDNMKFANQYALYLTITENGKKKGLTDMRTVNHIRKSFNDGFSLDSILRKSGSIFLRNGFLIERLNLAQVDLSGLNFNRTITMLYVKNTINDHVVNIIEGILTNMGYSFTAVAIDRNTSRENYREEQFDMVLKSAYVQFPEFLNLRYYKNYLRGSSRLYDRYKRRIDLLLAKGGTLDALEGEAQRLETELLKNFPIIFLLRYDTRIAVRNNTRNYQSSEGVPYFFYNLERW